MSDALFQCRPEPGLVMLKVHEGKEEFQLSCHVITWLTADHNKVETTQLDQFRMFIENKT